MNSISPQLRIQFQKANKFYNILWMDLKLITVPLNTHKDESFC